MTIQNVITCFNTAKDRGTKYVGLAILIPGAKIPKIIINDRDNFKAELNYYSTTYSNDLSLMSKPDVKIIGITSGNSFADIQEDLLGEC